MSTTQILKFLYVLAWVLFIGMCIEAGGFLFNIIFTLAINPAEAQYFWNQADLSDLYRFDSGYFVVVTSLMTIAAILKALMLYLIVKLLHDKKLNLSKPFSPEVGRFIFNLSYLSLGIGLFSYSVANYAEWFKGQGVEMPEIQYMRVDGADVWLFMGVILFIIAQIFKRGIEIQTENDLTI